MTTEVQGATLMTPLFATKIDRSPIKINGHYWIRILPGEDVKGPYLTHNGNLYITISLAKKLGICPKGVGDEVD